MMTTNTTKMIYRVGFIVTGILFETVNLIIKVLKPNVYVLNDIKYRLRFYVDVRFSDKGWK